MMKKFLAIFFAAAIFLSGGGSWSDDGYSGGGSWGSDMESQYDSDYSNGGGGCF